ncbi:MAG: ABC transporter permease, partial [Clostridia bacterium]|nr:ABC transporter permease [Clostridia bacterium]
LPPVLSVLFMMLVSGGGSSSISLGIRDMDKSESSRQIIEYLEQSDKYAVSLYEDDSYLTDITEKDIRAGIVIPDGFESSLINQQPLMVELYSIEGVSVLGWLDAFINQKISVIFSVSQSSQYHQLLEGYKDKYLTLKVNEITDLSNKADASQTGFGMYLFASVFSIWGICALSYKEKIYRTYQRILTTPARNYHFVFGNILSCMWFAMVHMLISIPVIYLLFDIKDIIPAGDLIVLMLCLYLSTISLGSLLVSTAKSQSSVSAMNILILSITSMLGGCYWPIDFMPVFMQNIAKVTPQYWFNTAITKMIKGEGIGANLIVLLCFFALYVLIYLLIAKFKKNNISAT